MTGPNKTSDPSRNCGYKGVFKVRNKYRALLSIGRKKIHLGCFAMAEAAAAAHDEAALRHFQGLAGTNSSRTEVRAA